MSLGPAATLAMREVTRSYLSRVESRGSSRSWFAERPLIGASGAGPLAPDERARAAVEPGLPIAPDGHGLFLGRARGLGGIPEAAPVLGISAPTARTHLQRIFAKTDTTRQADLVKLVASYMNPLA
jgi:hypothetical protein